MEYYREHFRAFDFLRSNTTLFMGEHVWNFADFMTKQGKSYLNKQKNEPAWYNSFFVCFQKLLASSETEKELSLVIASLKQLLIS
jgi:hypothetical protein